MIKQFRFGKMMESNTILLRN